MNFFKKIFSRNKKPKSRFKARKLTDNLSILIADIYNKELFTQEEQSTINDGLSALRSFHSKNKKALMNSKRIQVINMLSIFLQKMGEKKNQKIFLDKE